MSESHPDGAGPPEDAGWRRSRWLALAEFAVVGLIFYADSRHLIPLSKTPFLFLLGWGSLRLRGLRWRDVGLTRDRAWIAVIGLGVGAGLLMEAFQLFVSQPLLVRLTGEQPDLSDFRSLHGNLKLLLVFLALTWTLAAFGEELVWRGYLMNRAADLGKRTRAAWVVSLLAVNAVFGFAHAYQGITGILDESLMGFLLGLLYLGRLAPNLAVPSRS